MECLIFFMLFAGLVSVLTGGSFMGGALECLLFFSGLAFLIWWIRKKSSEHQTPPPPSYHHESPDQRSTQCRKCGRMTRPCYQSSRGTASYNCPCGRSWTIRW